MTRTPTERRGTQYGNTRGKERQRRKRDNRDKQGRNAEAAEATRRHQLELHALIERQKREPAMGETAGAKLAREQKERADMEAKQAAELAAIEAQPEPELESDTEPPIGSDGDFDFKAAPVKIKVTKVWKFNPDKLPQEGEGTDRFAVTTARIMFKAGYRADHVIAKTGVGWKYLQSMPHDEDGYGTHDMLERQSEACDTCRRYCKCEPAPEKEVGSVDL